MVTGSSGVSAIEKPLSCCTLAAISSKESVFTYSSIVSWGSRSIRRSGSPVTLSPIVLTFVLSAMENQATVAAVTATSARIASKRDVYTRVRIIFRSFFFPSLIGCPPQIRLHKTPDEGLPRHSLRCRNSPDHSPPGKNTHPPDKSLPAPS